MEKLCTKCGELKPLDAFSRAKLGRLGRAAECKKCHGDRVRKNRPRERSEAIRLGLHRYFTGRPCSNGHIAERFTSGTCVECAKLHRQLYPENPDHKQRRKKRWDEENADHVRAYRQTNRNHSAFTYAIWRAGPACPPWADLTAIEAFYLACPPEMIVDHIVAFKGITSEKHPVSGLHVGWNLQYLSPKDNERKNRHVRTGQTPS